jgi:xylulokinase
MVALGIDVGSSSVKCALVDIPTGKTLAIARCPEQEMAIHSPHSGWAEQNPEDWWQYTCRAIQEVCAYADISPSQIACIGIGYQMHGLVAVDAEGQPVRPSIIWCDSRAVVFGDALSAALPFGIMEKHLLNHPGNFTAAKLSWVKDHEPEVYERIHKVMLPGDYMAYKMTGEYTTTRSGLSEGIWYDFQQEGLSVDMLKAGGHDASILPKVGGNMEVLACTHEAFHRLTGISPGTPISFRAGDQPCNAFSLGVLEPGQAAATGGTSGVVYAVSDTPHQTIDAGFNTFLHVNHQPRQPRLGNLLCINGTGIMYAWVRNQAFPGRSYEDMANDVLACPAGSDGLICLPFGNGAERMLQNLTVGASFSGLDLNRHTRSHVARAALEGIAFAFAYGMERMAAAGIAITTLRTGNDNLFRSDVFRTTLADISGVPIAMYHTTGAVGAAMGSAYGAGFLESLNRVGEAIEHVSTIEPRPLDATMVKAFECWKEVLSVSMTAVSR